MYHRSPSWVLSGFPYICINDILLLDLVAIDTWSSPITLRSILIVCFLSLGLPWPVVNDVEVIARNTGLRLNLNKSEVLI